MVSTKLRNEAKRVKTTQNNAYTDPKQPKKPKLPRRRPKLVRKSENESKRPKSSQGNDPTRKPKLTKAT